MQCRSARIVDISQTEKAEALEKKHLKKEAWG